jgi:hypothetical protein
MKNVNIKLLLLIFVISISVLSCKKDDDNGPTFKNYLKYDGKYYELKFGYLEYYGAGWGAETSYNFDIYLSSISEDEMSLKALPKLNFMYFEMFSSSSTQLVSGTYNFNGESISPFTFDIGEFGLDYLSNDTYYEVNGGSVVIGKSGTTYEITIDCTDLAGKKISGYYKGELEYYDWSNFKGSKEEIKNMRFK